MFEQLSNAEQRILKQLAQKGEATGYMLSIWDRELKRGTTRDAMRNLENKKLIKLVRVEKHKPRDKRYYDISLPGLLVFLSERENWSDRNAISDVAKNHQGMVPLIFGNWTYIVKEGARDIVIKMLQKLFSDKETAEWLYLVSMGLLTPLVPCVDAESEGEKLAEYMVQDRITTHVIFQGRDPYLYKLYEYEINGKPQIDQEIEQWVKVLAGNRELKRYAMEKLKEHRKSLREKLHHIKLWEDLIKAASKQRRTCIKKASKPLSREEEKLFYDIQHRMFPSDT